VVRTSRSTFDEEDDDAEELEGPTAKAPFKYRMHMAVPDLEVTDLLYSADTMQTR
jgi:hypothetical protein